MSSGIKIEDGFIKLDIDYFFEAMGEDEQKQFVKSFAVQRNVIDHVIDYICGDDPDGWWTGYADENRCDILRRVEKTQLRRWSKYNWRVFDEIKDCLKWVRSKQHIYWELYHNTGDWDSDFRKRIHDWLNARGIESQYTTEQADEDIKRIENMVREKTNRALNFLEESFEN